MESSESIFGSEFFAGNRARLRTLFSGTAPIVITANGLLQRSADTTFTFRQDSNFWYLTGLDEPDLILVLDKEKEYLILPAGYEARRRFDGGQSVEWLAQRSGIVSVLENEAGWKQLSNRLKKVKHVATLAALPAYIEHYNFYTNPARATMLARIQEINPAIELLDLRQHLTKLRVIKQPAELQAIEEAIAVTAAGLKKVQRKLGSYTSEQAIAADLTYEFSQRGAQHAFDPVVASGAHAVTIHHMSLAGHIPKGQSILLDVGAEVEHYAADISRTYFTKPPTKRQVAVYEAVLEVQEFALAKMRPGTVPEKYEEEVKQFLGEKLRELGLVKSIEPEAIKPFMPHYTSHSLGLDTHDPSDHEQPLAPGMVWTVEPGIYIQEEGLGVRIEDDVLITEQGNTVLTARLPKRL
jgi:Xaa-Pro aminopeptidase